MERSAQFSPKLKNILSGYIPLKHTANSNSRIAKFLTQKTSNHTTSEDHTRTNSSETQMVKIQTCEDQILHTQETSQMAVSESLTEATEKFSEQYHDDSDKQMKSLPPEDSERVYESMNTSSNLKGQINLTLSKYKKSKGGIALGLGSGGYIPSNTRVPYFSKRNKKLEKSGFLQTENNNTNAQQVVQIYQPQFPLQKQLIQQQQEMLPHPHPKPTLNSVRSLPGSAIKAANSPTSKPIFTKRNLSISDPDSLGLATGKDVEINSKDLKIQPTQNLEFRGSINLEEFDLDQLEKQTKIYDYILSCNS
jgi:hypothetical protein